MTYSPFVVPLLLACVILVGLAIYARRFGDVAAARPFIVLMLLAASAAFLQALAILTIDLPLRMVWAQLIYVPVAFMPPVALWMALAYVGSEQWLTRERWILLLLVPALIAVLTLTSNWHPFFRYDYRLDFSGPLPVLMTQKGAGYWLYLLYSTAVVIATCVVLATAARVSHIHRDAALWLIAGILLPLLADLLNAINVSPIRGYSFGSSLFALSGLMFAWTLFRQHLFEISPIARQTVLDHLDTLVFVFNQRAYLVDMNAPARKFSGFADAMLGKQPDALPQPWATIFANAQPNNEPRTLEISANGETYLFALSVVLLQDAHKRLRGHAYLLHDETARKRIEKELSDTRAILEAAFAQSPTAMAVIGAKDNRIQIVNAAMLRHMGLSDQDHFDVDVYPDMRREWKNLDMQGNPVPVEELPLSRALRGLTTQNLEMAMEFANGELRYDLNNAAPIYNADGELIAAFAVYSDITSFKHMERALRASEERYRQLADNSPIAVALVDMQTGKILYANPRALELFGLTREQAVGSTAIDRYANPQDREKVLGALRANGQVLDMPLLMKKSTGETFWAAINSNISTYENRPVIHTSYYDITERKNAEQALRESETLYRTLAENMRDVVWILDNVTEYFRYISPSVFQLRGYTPQEIMAEPYTAALTPESAEHVRELTAQRVQHFLEHPDRNNRQITETEQPCKDGSTVWTEVVTHFYLNPATGHVETLGVTREITERKHLQEKLLQQATTDELTGIFNRRQFVVMALNELRRAARFKTPVALALLDIDYFKNINDTYGHAAGDAVLQTFTQICKANLREVDVFARFGGDEFALLLPATEHQQAYAVLERIRSVIAAHPFTIQDRTIACTISVGITGTTDESADLDELLGHADQALYHAKKEGRNRVAVIPIA